MRAISHVLTYHFVAIDTSSQKALSFSFVSRGEVIRVAGELLLEEV